jgi:hypothetical protein
MAGGWMVELPSREKAEDVDGHSEDVDPAL